MKSNINSREDVANWTALRMRQMHKPIKEGLFMEGGLTPHQWLTKEITELLAAECKKAAEKQDKKWENAMERSQLVFPFFIGIGLIYLLAVVIVLKACNKWKI
jgi:hypothetical protein